MGPRLPTHACFSRVVQGQHESLSQTETQATLQRPAATFHPSREHLGLFYSEQSYLIGRLSLDCVRTRLQRRTTT